jgi:two-component system response regulator AtoC
VSDRTDPSPIRVLLAEDEAHLGMILEQYLVARGFDVVVVRDGRAALDTLRADSFDVALLDVVMPELDGLEVLRRVREDPMPPEILVITGNGTSETAMTALKLGAYDFLSKPYRMAEVEALVRRAWEKRMLVHDNHVLSARLGVAGKERRFVTQYAPLSAVMTMVRHVASSTAPVFFSGEAGTGKRLVARVMHDGGDRARGPFVEVDCRRIARERQDAELFGVEGHAPSGDARAMGALERARGGTIYLQHVGSLERAVQGRLLGALEEGGFFRVGGGQRVRLDTRIVVSSMHDGARLVQQGTLQRDFARVMTAVQVALPPLRERVVDVSPLSEHFAEVFGEGMPVRISPEVVARLEQYRWPGNVRELRNVIERALLLAVNGYVEPGDLALGERSPAGGEPIAADELSLEALERRHIGAVLERTHWHQGRAADALGISPKTLYRKIREFGFVRPSSHR